MEKNRKRLVIRTILIIVVTIILLLIAHICRNYFIGQEIMRNMIRYMGSTNYHFTEKAINKNESSIVDIYVKNDRRASFTKEDYDEVGTEEMAVYCSGDKMNIYKETTDGKKFAMIGVDNSDPINFFLGYYVDISPFEFLSSLISEVMIDGKVCYKINTIFDDVDDNPDYVFEKETGLIVGLLYEDFSVKLEYEFDKVEDSIFIEPNLEEYEIIEK